MVLEKQRQELELQAFKMQELNTTLKVLLEQHQEARREAEQSALTSMEILALPYLKRLKQAGLTPEQTSLVEIVESNLRGILSTSSLRNAKSLISLTPTEIDVANLVRLGKRSRKSPLCWAWPRTRWRPTAAVSAKSSA